MSSYGACRFCGAPLRHSFCDLGMSPLSNALLGPEQLHDAERFYPLHALVCDGCWLVQLGEFESPERIFGHYVYFSSYSESWLRHARAYAEMIRARLGLGADSFVVEVASNDGYLLRNFVQAGIPALGIEPAANVAQVAREAGVDTLVRFFGTEVAGELAAQGRQADLVAANNVLAHVPALNDFVAGLRALLKPAGVATLEFPHLVRLMAENQFDTIYHEHFSYFSLLTVRRVMEAHGLRVFDVEELPTHGGSLRVYACRDEAPIATEPAVEALLERERAFGLERLETYLAFGERVREVKWALLEFLIRARREGKRVVGYGAAAKGNTLLNYCGIRTDFVDYVVDRSPHKQGLFLPGTHVPVLAPEEIARTRPDYVLILPWNLRDEIMRQMGEVRDWGGRFVVPIPTVQVLG
ncbi:class I SAM-dependent methyltransferase [Longimicrobium sp.]|uniref:class I SAM-dependent methyltransferase n=1 Tax=Longimicrobium sp. TaxID=2029185 RepID=UPI002E341E51|nr:class I SAM-dependent methyltransferase [Longimicrobium sp.]HEX6040825.1 class I SAM-dependent methyltransferase [Longimicrobium sp.]